jgi:hypothetical protein
VIACDPATGEEDTDAAFAIEIIDHETREQCRAVRGGQTEPDLVAEQLYLACLLYGAHRRPWLCVERTGGYGLSLIDALYHEYGYRQMYTRRKPDAATGNYADRLGWDTNRQTKGLLHDEAMALLREGTHGIRSVRLSRQMETYVRKGSGRTGPLPGARSDLLLAWMIAQTVASRRRRASRASAPRSRRTGASATPSPATEGRARCLTSAASAASALPEHHDGAVRGSRPPLRAAQRGASSTPAARRASRSRVTPSWPRSRALKARLQPQARHQEAPTMNRSFKFLGELTEDGFLRTTATRSARACSISRARSSSSAGSCR